MRSLLTYIDADINAMSALPPVTASGDPRIEEMKAAEARQQLDKLDPLTEAEARGIVGLRMVAEAREILHHQQFIQDGIARIPRFRQRASELVERMAPKSWWERLIGPH